MPPSTHLAALIRTLREAQGWSQDQLAERIALGGHGYRRTTVYRWEAGAREPSQARWRDLCRVLPGFEALTKNLQSGPLIP